MYALPFVAVSYESSISINTKSTSYLILSYLISSYPTFTFSKFALTFTASSLQTKTPILSRKIMFEPSLRRPLSFLSMKSDVVKIMKALNQTKPLFMPIRVYMLQLFNTWTKSKNQCRFSHVQSSGVAFQSFTLPPFIFSTARKLYWNVWTLEWIIYIKTLLWTVCYFVDILLLNRIILRFSHQKNIILEQKILIMWFSRKCWFIGRKRCNQFLPIIHIEERT